MDLSGRPQRLLLAAALPFAAAFVPADAVRRAPAAGVLQDSVPGWFVDARTGAAKLVRDTTEKHGGSASAYLKSDPASGEVQAISGRGQRDMGPGIPRIRLQQAINARPYRERRVRLSLWIKTKLPAKPEAKMPVSKVAVFMRIENEDATQILYDGEVSPLYGNTEWTRKFVVLEVPADGHLINFGVVVTGPGEVWVDDVLLEDQAQAMGPYNKLPIVPPAQQAQMPAEMVDRLKERFERSKQRSATLSAEIANADLEAK